MELSAFALKRCHLTVVNLTYLLDVATGLLQKNGLVCFCIVTPHLLLMACFGDINVSQGSVAIYARCGGSFNIHLTANYQ